MRKSMIVAVLAAVAIGGVAGCAHPQNEVPLPGESPTATTPAAATTTATGADETKTVCAEAISVSNSTATTLKSKLAEGQAALAANNQAGALAAAAAAKSAATDWSNKLKSLQSRPIKPAVKTVLSDGVTMIDSLMASTNINPTEAEAKLNDFTTKLAAACA
jgi:hypothetical protein